MFVASRWQICCHKDGKLLSSRWNAVAMSSISSSAGHRFLRAEMPCMTASFSSRVILLCAYAVRVTRTNNHWCQRVTLPYFVEPTASRRAGRQRYTYPSPSLGFELQDPLETEAQFIRRVNRDAETEEDGGRSAAGQIGWLVGPSQRNLRSLHQDIGRVPGSSSPVPDGSRSTLSGNGGRETGAETGKGKRFDTRWLFHFGH